jgi:hypothetical protein
MYFVDAVTERRKEIKRRKEYLTVGAHIYLSGGSVANLRILSALLSVFSATLILPHVQYYAFKPHPSHSYLILYLCIVLPKISVRYVAVLISGRSLIKEDCNAAGTAVDVLKELV